MLDQNANRTDSLSLLEEIEIYLELALEEIIDKKKDIEEAYTRGVEQGKKEVANTMAKAGIQESVIEKAIGWRKYKQ